MRELNIDWAALHSAFQMNMPEVRCFLSMEDGRVLKLPPGDPALATVRADPQRYMAIDAIPSRIQYQWLDEFIKAIEDENIRARMEAAINGKGAFRRFKDILLTLPDERRRWFEYRDQMMRQRILDWVREQSILALNEAPWANGQLTNLPGISDSSAYAGTGHSGDWGLGSTPYPGHSMPPPAPTAYNPGMAHAGGMSSASSNMGNVGNIGNTMGNNVGISSVGGHAIHLAYFAHAPAFHRRSISRLRRP